MNSLTVFTHVLWICTTWP